MAERRMVAKTIIDSDAFLDLSVPAQNLYFHLLCRADDDGFVNKPRAIMNMVGARNEDMRQLIDNKFLILFESGVVVIKHWRIHNYIRKDTYHETKYKFEKATLYLDENNAYSTNPQALTEPSTSRGRAVNEPLTEVRLGKDSIGKDSIGESNTSKDTAHADKSTFGEFNNVYLSVEEMEKLHEKFPDDFLERIDYLSHYMHSNNKTYADHYSTICQWAHIDKARAAAKAAAPKDPQPQPTVDMDYLKGCLDRV